jgi:hypothetical protein
MNQLISDFAEVIKLLRTPTLKSLVLIMSAVTVPGGVEVYNLSDFFYFYFYFFYLLSRDRRLSKQGLYITQARQQLQRHLLH